MDRGDETTHKDDIPAPEDELSDEDLENVTGGLNHDIIPFGPGNGMGGVPMPLPTSTDPGVRPDPPKP